jgi:hypothetical protein
MLYNQYGIAPVFVKNVSKKNTFIKMYKLIFYKIMII